MASICMQFTVLSLNILPWTLYCSKWQVLCILLLIKQKILKYCCGRLGPDFSINGMLSKQHAQHLEEFAISCECSFLHLYHCNSEKATTLVQQSTSRGGRLCMSKLKLDGLSTSTSIHLCNIIRLFCFFGMESIIDSAVMHSVSQKY